MPKNRSTRRKDAWRLRKEDVVLHGGLYVPRRSTRHTYVILNGEAVPQQEAWEIIGNGSESNAREIVALAYRYGGVLRYCFPECKSFWDYAGYDLLVEFAETPGFFYLLQVKSSQEGAKLFIEKGQQRKNQKRIPVWVVPWKGRKKKAIEALFAIHDACVVDARSAEPRLARFALKHAFKKWERCATAEAERKQQRKQRRHNDRWKQRKQRKRVIRQWRRTAQEE